MDWCANTSRGLILPCYAVRRGPTSRTRLSVRDVGAYLCLHDTWPCLLSPPIKVQPVFRWVHLT